MCSFEALLVCFLSGQGFSVIDSLRELLSLFRLVSYGNAKLVARADHYYRWLLKDISSIVVNPSCSFMTVTASDQPKCSHVRQDMSALLATTRYAKINWSSAFEMKNCWMRGETLGGNGDFTPLLLSLSGHSYYVYSVCLSADGSMVISGSGDNSIKVWDAVSGACLSTLKRLKAIRLVYSQYA